MGCAVTQFVAEHIKSQQYKYGGNQKGQAPVFFFLHVYADVFFEQFLKQEDRIHRENKGSHEDDKQVGEQRVGIQGHMVDPVEFQDKVSSQRNEQERVEQHA